MENPVVVPVGPQRLKIVGCSAKPERVEIPMWKSIGVNCHQHHKQWHEKFHFLSFNFTPQCTIQPQKLNRFQARLLYL
jgi:hypothetical protein